MYNDQETERLLKTDFFYVMVMRSSGQVKFDMTHM